MNTNLIERAEKRPFLVYGISLLLFLLLIPILQAKAVTMGNIVLPFNYTFGMDGVLNETSSSDLSSSPYWWLSSGGQLIVKSGTGQSLQGNVPTSNKWNGIYAKSSPIASDNGSHPQNLFSLFLRLPALNTDQSVSVMVKNDNLSNAVNRNPWNGVLLISRWKDNNNYYYAGIRADGHAILKKKINGVYYTLAEKTLIPGTWSAISNPNLLPKNTWIKLRSTTNTESDGNVRIRLYADLNQSGNWQLVLETTDNGSKGSIVSSSGLSGIRSDFADIVIDNYNTSNIGISSTTTSTTVSTSTVPTATSTTPVTTSIPSNVLFSDAFSGYSDGLITNEYAYWNKTSSLSKQSPLWELDSGSLFAIGGNGWTGVPDNISPNNLSTNGNNSSVFRLVTKQSNFGNVAVSFNLLNQGLTNTASTPSVSWDGLHVFLRYQNEYNLYYVSVNRRDNTVTIKKKVSGGSSNGGTYYVLSKYTPHTVQYNAWKNVKATVKNNLDGSVTIELYVDGNLLVRSVDNGTIGGAPIRTAGKVGVRGDNANLKFKNFLVTSI